MREEKVMCSSCANQLAWNAALYDEQEELFFCDECCFQDWASNHFEVILEQYKALHVIAD